MRRRTWKTKRTREKTSKTSSWQGGWNEKKWKETVTGNGNGTGMGWDMAWDMGWDGPRTRLPSLITILINLFKWEKRALYGNDSWGRRSSEAIKSRMALWYFSVPTTTELKLTLVFGKFYCPTAVCPLLLLLPSFSFSFLALHCNMWH